MHFPRPPVGKNKLYLVLISNRDFKFPRLVKDSSVMQVNFDLEDEIVLLSVVDASLDVSPKKY